MPPLNFIITNAGLAELTHATTIGPVVLERIVIGSSGYTAQPSQTQLVTPIKEIIPQGSSVVAPNTIHITASDYTNDSYHVHEIGLITSTGILFAVYAQETTILVKSAEVVALFALDFVMTGVPPGHVTIGDANFQYPPATETVRGVAQIATQEEVAAGIDHEKIVTPATLKGYQYPAAAPGIKGVAQIANQADVNAGTNNNQIVTPATLHNAPCVAKAWVSFHGKTAHILSSYNVSYIHKIDSGKYQIYFIQPIGGYYLAFGNANWGSSGNDKADDNILGLRKREAAYVEMWVGSGFRGQGGWQGEDIREGHVLVFGP